MNNPFSDNIIFLDTEFSTLDPYKGEILSIGLVKLNGEELYLELDYDGETSNWVKENILPLLNNKKVNRDEAVRRIKDFVGNTKPYAISNVNQYDTIYLYKLLRLGNGGENPFFWIPIDFASILFSMGLDPENDDWKIDKTKYKEHHALDDAKCLREAYLKIFNR